MRRRFSAMFATGSARKNFYHNHVHPTFCKNPHFWWKNVNKIVGKKKQSITLFDPQTEHPMDEKQATEHINECFASLTEDFIEVQDKWLDGGSSEPLSVISEESVEIKLKGHSVRKASGPYDPNIKVLKMFAKNFAIPLENIFNESFRSRIFPKIWKCYNVCAIPKVTPCSAVEDLRPISLTNVLSKIQESYAIEWINQDVGANVNESQYGGLPESSAVLALVNLIHK
jgi:DNA-binding XRE family transcriptional regulator